MLYWETVTAATVLASLALYGDQNQHIHVRLLTAVELLQYREYYDVSCRSYAGEPGMDAITGTYDQLMEATTTPSISSGYAELMHIYAISAAFGVAISSAMPTVGVTNNPYTRMVFGRSRRSSYFVAGVHYDVVGVRRT